MTEWIEDSAQTPAMLIGHLGRYRGTGRDRLCHHRGGIIHHQQGPARRTANSQRAETRPVRPAR
jgi:hypothetical protein